jgi:hypothetical protein
LLGYYLSSREIQATHIDGENHVVQASRSAPIDARVDRRRDRSFAFRLYPPRTRHGTNRPVVSFATVKPVLESLANELPPELKKNSESNWNAWTRQEDDLVRARLEQGGLDSMVNVL